MTGHILLRAVRVVSPARLERIQRADRRPLIAHIHKQAAGILPRRVRVDRLHRDWIGRGNGVRRIWLLGQDAGWGNYAIHAHRIVIVWGRENAVLATNVFVVGHEEKFLSRRASRGAWSKRNSRERGRNFAYIERASAFQGQTWLDGKH